MGSDFRLTFTVSCVVLFAALFVILSKNYPPTTEHWAYAAIGTIMGFWLRGSEHRSRKNSRA